MHEAIFRKRFIESFVDPKSWSDECGCRGGKDESAKAWYL